MEKLLALLLLPGLAAAYETTPWPLPAPAGSAQPNLSLAPGGEILLSWIERPDGGTDGGKAYRLVFAGFDHGRRWSEPRQVASGTRWFVNWADFPAVQALGDGSLWAHTLEKSGEGPYAYDVVLRRSGDGGRTWSAPRIAHDDGTATEHGFASLWPWSRDSLAVAWLDGRNTGGGEGHGGHDGHGGMMSLRAAVFGPRQDKRHEWQLDASTCDCCQTDAALGAEGPLLAYRDRDADEIRDIYLTRHDGKRWTPPLRVHADQWKMPACPVNGPAIAASGKNVWVAWYTGAGDAPSVRIARSPDGGRRFEPMRQVAGDDVQGRVELAADGKAVWMLWMSETAGKQALWLARYSLDLKTEFDRGKVADITGSGRGTGFPRMQLRDGIAHLAWTEIVAGQPRLRGLRIQP